MADVRISNDSTESKNLDTSITNSKIQESVIAYYDDLKPDSRYMRDIGSIVKQANKYLNLCVSEQKKLAYQDKLAIVLDIDDTSVSNYHSIVKDNFKNTQDEIINRYRASNQPVIKPVLELSQKAINKGISVFFITHRKPHDSNPIESLRPYTLTTLERAGYKDWSGLFIPKGKEKKLTSTNFKIKKRRAITKEGYRIILNIGDQVSDLEGGYSERTFKLPNYLYPKLGVPSDAPINIEESKCSSNPINQDDTLPISSMVVSAFGQSSNTAKQLNLRTHGLFKNHQKSKDFITLHENVEEIKLTDNSMLQRL